jgi:UDP-2,3-diacylglucosamine hydrolase
VHHLQLPAGKKIFFASDFHLGAPDFEQSRLREQKIIRWLQSIESEAEVIFLVGDIFDFWFEYRSAIPKGFVRLQGKLAELTDRGISVIFFSGNHDMWMFDYFTKEMGIPIFHKPQEWQINQFRFLIAHGDGLGPGDYTYKIIQKIFRNPICQWLFARLHPNFGIGLASFLSRRSRARNLKKASEEQFLGEKEWLWQYCKDIEKQTHHDFYVFGHRHLPLDLEVGAGSRYLNLGEWLKYDTYGVFDGQSMQIVRFEE